MALASANAGAEEFLPPRGATPAGGAIVAASPQQTPPPAATRHEAPGTPKKLRWVSPSKKQTAHATPVRHADFSETEHTAVQPVVAHEAAPTRLVGASATAIDPFQDPFDDGLTTIRPKAERTVARLVTTEQADEPLLAIEAAQPNEAIAPPGVLPPAEEDRELQSDLAPQPNRPSLEEELAQGPGTGYGPCPSPKELKRINEITDDITPEGTEFPQECTLGDDMFEPRCWAMTTYHWKASALCHKPLYFQQVAVERYGHTWPLIQPLVSAANFFGTFPVLPYKIGLNLPWECVYPLGYYRPGSCAPYMINAVPISLRAGLFEAGAWVGGVYLIP